MKRWWLPALALLLANLATVKLNADRLQRLGFDMNSSLDEWIAQTKGSDCGFTLDVAKNIAEGKGVVQHGPDPHPEIMTPFCYWGPGAPWGLGAWLWLTNAKTMWSCFVFSALSQFCFGIVALATVALYTKRLGALLLTAIFAGYCPPMQSVFYSWMITCSEIVALVPIGIGIYSLAKAFQMQSRPDARMRSIVLWFAVAGLWFGVASLAREVLTAFVLFVGLILILRTRLRGWRRIGTGLAYASALYFSLHVVRLPVQIWNKSRIGHFVVSTGGGGFNLICRGEWWQKHDSFSWAEDMGVGFGEYLDPEAPARVEAAYAANSRWAAFNCVWEMTRAICRRPYDAIEFKVARWPVLWLDARRWPNTELSYSSYWCIGTYLVFFAFVFRQWKTRQAVPDILWLYPLFAFLMSIVAHSEFRYGISCWHGFVLVPGLLWHSWRTKQSSAKNGGDLRPVVVGEVRELQSPKSKAA